jgi:hypothetical protein
VLRRIFGPKRGEVRRERRSLHKKELYALFCSPTIIPVIKSKGVRWRGYAARVGKRLGAHKILVGKPEGMSPLRRLRSRWKDNIKMDL